MKQVTFIVLAFALLTFSCKKNETIKYISTTDTAVLHDFTCRVYDSAIYAFRTCANSKHYDTTNLYFPALNRHSSQFNSISSADMSKIIASWPKIQVINDVDLLWLNCGSGSQHDKYDTIYDYQKLICTNN